MHPPLPDEDRLKILELHAAGVGRNEIAKRVSRGVATVTRVVHAAGGSFDRAATREAVEAAKTDAKLRRAQLALDLLDDAQRLREQLFEPAVVFNFGGKDNTYEERTVDEPTFTDKRNILQAVSTAANAAMKLDQHDREDGAMSAVDAWIEATSGNADSGSVDDQTADG